MNAFAPLLQDAFEQIRVGAIEAALEGVVTVDDEQRIVMINPAAQRMFGCEAADVLGRDMSCLIPARLRKAHARHVAEFDRSGATELPRRARTSMVGARASGEEFPMEVSVSRVQVADALGPRRYFTVLMRDLSAQRSAEEAIEVVIRRLHAVFDLAPIAIWITDGERITFANRACAALFGAGDSVELVGRDLFTLLEPSSHDAVRQQMRRAQAGGASAGIVRERIKGLVGPPREVDIAVASLPDHGRLAVQMVITDITEQARAHAEAQRTAGELRRLAEALVGAREDEQRRIARELHDELGQWLTALKMELAGLVAPVPSATQQAQVARLGEMVDEVIHAMRRIATDLRPAMLDDLGLNAAIEALARESARRMGVKITLQLGDADPPVGERATTALYRMAQEALTNIARHARASAVQIELGQAPGQVTLRVSDNGVGFAARSPQREDALGLVGMRERASALGGDMTIGDLPGGGAFVMVRLPADASLARPEVPASPAGPEGA